MRVDTRKFIVVITIITNTTTTAAPTAATPPPPYPAHLSVSDIQCVTLSNDSTPKE